MRTLVFLMLVSLGFVAPLGDAHACTGCFGAPYFGGASGPEDGGAYPSNAAVFLYGSGLTVDGALVTVDGAPASLVEVPELQRGGACGPFRAFRVEPEPPEGAAVELSGELCDPTENDTCDTLSLHWTASAADLVAPSPPTAVTFDLYRPRSEWACAEIANTVAYFHIDADFNEPQETTARWRIEVLPAPDAEPTEVLMPRRDPEPYYATLDEIAGPSESPCFRISAIDDAGNASAPLTVCDPCHFKVDPADSTPWSELPPEPDWKNADLVDGGACAEGGGCAVDPRPARGPFGRLGLLALAGLALAAPAIRRRRG
ncbi:MAG: hypothetical protein KC486_04265 [Myxococcales bacterium]|nr:hypothetical protein [Myxococcales bacterium]